MRGYKNKEIALWYPRATVENPRKFTLGRGPFPQG